MSNDVQYASDEEGSDEEGSDASDQVDDEGSDDEDEDPVPVPLFLCHLSPCPHPWAFSSGAHLREHIEMVHLKIKHPCFICLKMFASILAVKRHLKTQHL